MLAMPEKEDWQQRSERTRAMKADHLSDQKVKYKYKYRYKYEQEYKYKYIYKEAPPDPPPLPDGHILPNLTIFLVNNRGICA